MAGSTAMSGFGQAVQDYLALRRSLGHDLAEAARLLPGLVTYLDDNGESTLTTSVVMAWAMLPDAATSPTVWPRRVTAARGFARYMTGIDPKTEIPPLGVIPYRQRWRPPFIYSPADIVALMQATHQLLPSPLRAATYETLIGLLATTGMRIGEAIKLERSDIDWSAGVILIRESKFGKTRHVPVQSSTLEALEAFASRRDHLQLDQTKTNFFVSRNGNPLIYADVSETFRRLISTAGVGTCSSARPRLHDMRHTFAVATLLRWYRDGGDVQSRLPWLSTYLGHRDPRSTYWYLSAAPELLALAANRLEGIGPVIAP
jgi:integrase/recombinase XerD